MAPEWDAKSLVVSVTLGVLYITSVYLYAFLSVLEFLWTCHYLLPKCRCNWKCTSFQIPGCVLELNSLCRRHQAGYCSSSLMTVLQSSRVSTSVWSLTFAYLLLINAPSHRHGLDAFFLAPLFLGAGKNGNKCPDIWEQMPWHTELTVGPSATVRLSRNVPCSDGVCCTSGTSHTHVGSQFSMFDQWWNKFCKRICGSS